MKKNDANMDEQLKFFFWHIILIQKRMSVARLNSILFGFRKTFAGKKFENN